ncbi:PilZ domain-containing protein [Terasakiella sp.]|uniref:PilZ domain-containing protein n=1 Tax=Terasakiella sp. TaxID=2034861 RepID=UPI003AA88B2E
MVTENRKNRRQRIDFLASVRIQDREYEILVKDISIKGMKLQTRYKGLYLPIGQKVTIHIPFIADVDAIVSWHDEETHGLIFNNCPPVMRQFVESILPVGDHIEKTFKTESHSLQTTSENELHFYRD